jgi:ribosomal protein S18 acetylase RimI-like enzyme
VRIRAAGTEDLDFLEAMLFEAFFWNAAVERPAFPVFRQEPDFVKQFAGWGRPGDRALIADDSAAPRGSAWFRLWTRELHSYGFVDASTPELGIAVSMDWRGKGLGRALLMALIETAREDGYAALSLSVSPLNPARSLYESIGFERVGHSGTSWTLRLQLR